MFHVLLVWLMNRRELQELPRTRLHEAAILLAAQCYRGAYYLAGYAVECALKACIARKTRRHDFPNKDKVFKSYTHDLKQLVNVAELQRSLSQEVKSSRQFNINWAIVKDWSEESRYQLAVTPQGAQDLYVAITNRHNGVLRWIRGHW